MSTSLEMASRSRLIGCFVKWRRVYRSVWVMWVGHLELVFTWCVT